MIVCICNAVSDRSINEVIDGGARTVEAIGRACRAGTSCQTCRRVLERLLAEADAKRADDELKRSAL